MTVPTEVINQINEQRKEVIKTNNKLTKLRTGYIVNNILQERMEDRMVKSGWKFGMIDKLFPSTFGSLNQLMNSKSIRLESAQIICSLLGCTWEYLIGAEDFKLALMNRPILSKYDSCIRCMMFRDMSDEQIDQLSIEAGVSKHFVKELMERNQYVSYPFAKTIYNAYKRVTQGNCYDYDEVVSEIKLKKNTNVLEKFRYYYPDSGITETKIDDIELIAKSPVIEKKKPVKTVNPPIRQIRKLCEDMSLEELQKVSDLIEALKMVQEICG